MLELVWKEGFSRSLVEESLTIEENCNRTAYPWKE